MTLPTSLFDVVRRIDDLREELASALSRPLPEAELQLLYYDTGGFYGRHVDDGLSTAHLSCRRSVSFLLYLTEDDWQASDGGQLCIHTTTEDGHDGGLSEEILPTAGSLVMFDSASVPHSVRPTRRQRTALVGWLLEPR